MLTVGSPLPAYETLAGRHAPFKHMLHFFSSPPPSFTAALESHMMRTDCLAPHGCALSQSSSALLLTPPEVFPCCLADASPPCQWLPCPCVTECSACAFFCLLPILPVVEPSSLWLIAALVQASLVHWRPASCQLHGRSFSHCIDPCRPADL